MPSKRRHLARVADGELDEGQRDFLLGEYDPPSGVGLWAFNRHCWLWRAVDTGDLRMPDGSPGPRELWAMFGRDALELWHKAHGDEPHPLVEYLGLPPKSR